MNKIFLIFIGVFCLIFSCQEKKQEQENLSDVNTEVKRFLKQFDVLALPYQMLSDPQNHATFQALLGENHLLDSNFVERFQLNRSFIESELDSTHEQPESKNYHFYAIGKCFMNPKYTIILYGRDGKLEDDNYIFLASFDSKGQKIDEILFHKPLLALPPIEIKRLSIIKADSSFMLNSVTEESKFVDKKDKKQDYMQFVKKVSHEKFYKIDAYGKFILVNNTDKDLP
ncbi:MAG: hypothetical protein EAZ97_09255 [Bacteroidetes bacterium]|nr:MAG: hypothetical protein EAZ97_09255 [Bacteroidota bacterium]